MYHVLILILNYVEPQRSTQQDFLKVATKAKLMFTMVPIVQPGPVGISTLHNRDRLASEFGDPIY